MNKLTPTLYFLLFIYVFVNGCVTPKPPTGGPEDETPPVLQSIQKKKDKIILVFNENIVLGDPSKIVTNIYPSPEFIYNRNKVTIKGIPSNNDKQVIYFNESITDLNNNNPLRKYVYADKVGADTFSYSSNVTSLFNKVSNYKNCYVVLLDKPLNLTKPEDLYTYNFSKTDSKGSFEFNFIPDPIGKQIFSFIDMNNNQIPDELDYIGLSNFIQTDSTDAILLAYQGKNLLLIDTLDNTVIKSTFYSAPLDRLENPLAYKTYYHNDTSYNSSLFTDSLILSKNKNIIKNDIVYLLSGYNRKLYINYDSLSVSNNQFILTGKIKKDSILIITNGIDTVGTLSLVADEKLSSFTLKFKDSANTNHYNGILYNSNFFFPIVNAHFLYQNKKNKTVMVTTGTYKLFIYEDLNGNGKYDKPTLFPLLGGDKVIYNLKDIDIGAKMDVDISVIP